MERETWKWRRPLFAWEEELLSSNNQLFRGKILVLPNSFIFGIEKKVRRPQWESDALIHCAMWSLTLVSTKFHHKQDSIIKFWSINFFKSNVGNHKLQKQSDFIKFHGATVLKRTIGW